MENYPDGIDPLIHYREFPGLDEFVYLLESVSVPVRDLDTRKSRRDLGLMSVLVEVSMAMLVYLKLASLPESRYTITSGATKCVVWSHTLSHICCLY